MIMNGHAIDPDRLYTPAEWAEISKRSIKTLAKNRSMRDGEPFVRLGKLVFYRGCDIIRHIEGSLQQTGRQAAIERARALSQKGARRAGGKTQEAA